MIKIDVAELERVIASEESVAPVPDAALRDRIAEAVIDGVNWSGGDVWADPARIPEGDDPEDWSGEYVRWDYCNDEWRDHGYRIASAVLAVLPPVDGVTVPRELAAALNLAIKALERERGEWEDNLKRAQMAEDQTWLHRYGAKLNETTSAIAHIRALLGGEG